MKNDSGQAPKINPPPTLARYMDPMELPCLFLGLILPVISTSASHRALNMSADEG